MHTLIHQFISHFADQSPAADALIYKTHRLSYRTLSAELCSAAHGFLQLGLQRSERIATYLPKQPEAVVSLFAASAAGAAFVPVNPILKAQQVSYILKDCNVRILVTSLARLKQLAEHLAQCSDLHTVILVDKAASSPVSPLPHIKHIDIVFWDDIQSKSTVFPEIPNIDSDIAAILYTSGSTGNPKGVVLSHRNLISGAQSVTQYLHNTAGDRILAVLPLSFDYGLSQLTTAFSVGASVVLMDYLLPRDVIKAVSQYQITGLAAVPPLWIQLAQLDWPNEARASLRYLTNSGGALPVDTLSRLRAKLPDTLPYLMYGLTEAFRSTYVPPEVIDTHQDAIGIAIPNAEVLVLREDGSECADNEPGELVHRGSLVAMGYWNAPDRTAERFKPIPGSISGKILPEIAVWSGDTVKRDKDGFLYFISRKDDMIKTSGYRVSPNEIEEVVYQSERVNEAVALGIPHPVLGQAIVLVVVARSDSFQTAELLAFCRKQLPNFMQPSEIIVKTALERNQNGKIDRKQLVQEYIDLFIHQEQ